MEDHNWRPSWVVVALVDIVEIHTVDEERVLCSFSVFSDDGSDDSWVSYPWSDLEGEDGVSWWWPSLE